MQELNFVPVSAEQAKTISSGNVIPGPLVGFCANEALAATFELAVGSEEAEHAALLVAEVAGLSRSERPIVLTCEVPRSVTAVDESEADNGGVILKELKPEWVSAFFVDDAPAGLVAAAATAASGLSVDDAWDTPEVALLLEEDTLLWHDCSELGTL
ncbi:MAG: hypothetical protein LBM94_01625 [Propionibacteriaceae bacterium]|jgi:hypothetical protein|nr:hypothetical protein [Propionibacteriaceae bacterium]